MLAPVAVFQFGEARAVCFPGSWWTVFGRRRISVGVPDRRDTRAGSRASTVRGSTRRAATCKRPGRRLVVLRHQQRSSLGEMFSNAAATPTVPPFATSWRLSSGSSPRFACPAHRVNHDFTLHARRQPPELAARLCTHRVSAVSSVSSRRRSDGCPPARDARRLLDRSRDISRSTYRRTSSNPIVGGVVVGTGGDGGGDSARGRAVRW